MIVVNTEFIPGKRIVAVRGLVQGNTVRAKHLGRDIAAGFKNLVGGELRGYTELLVESRRQSMERMLAQAAQLGANAVVNVRFATSSITAGAAELYCYGTAVIVQDDTPPEQPQVQQQQQPLSQQQPLQQQTQTQPFQQQPQLRPGSENNPFGDL